MRSKISSGKDYINEINLNLYVQHYTCYTNYGSDDYDSKK